MSFTDKKITEGDIASQGVQSKPDKLTGTAAENNAEHSAILFTSEGFPKEHKCYKH